MMACSACKSPVLSRESSKAITARRELPKGGCSTPYDVPCSIHDPHSWQLWGYSSTQRQPTRSCTNCSCSQLQNLLGYVLQHTQRPSMTCVALSLSGVQNKYSQAGTASKQLQHFVRLPLPVHIEYGNRHYRQCPEGCPSVLHASRHASVGCHFVLGTANQQPMCRIMLAMFGKCGQTSALQFLIQHVASKLPIHMCCKVSVPSLESGSEHDSHNRSCIDTYADCVWAVLK